MPIQHRSRGNSAPATAPHSCLNDSACQHPSMLPLRKAAAKCFTCRKQHLSCSRKRRAGPASLTPQISGRGSGCLSDSVCQHSSMLPLRKAAPPLVCHVPQTPQLLPQKIRYHFWTLRAQIQHRSRCERAKQQLHPRCCLRDSSCQHSGWRRSRKLLPSVSCAANTPATAETGVLLFLG